MKTIILCSLLSIGYLFMFHIWGKTFLGLIHSKISLSESIVYGFIVMQIVFQFFYLPFFFTRGSFRLLASIWICASIGITIICFIYNWRKIGIVKKKVSYSPLQTFFILLAVALITWLCFIIALHPRAYGYDTNAYIDTMNQMVYHDKIWINNGILDVHHGLNSIFSLFAISSLITGVHPFHVALFTMRIVAVVLTAMTVYRTGKAFFDRNKEGVSWYALALSAIVPLAFTFWKSMYTGEFFWIRSNEAKAYCQYILLPLAFSVCVEAFMENSDHRLLWKKQMAIGLAAMPVAASSMTTYLLTIIVSTAALLAFSRLKNAKRIVLYALLCMLPNLCYLVFYIMYR